MSDTSMQSVPVNFASVVGHLNGHKKTYQRRAVSLFAGWSFIRFREGSEESFPIMPRFDLNAPTFEFNPDCVGLEHLENPNFAPFWVPLALSQVCSKVLAHAMNDEENHVGGLVGAGWDSFRNEVLKHCEMTFEQLIRSARVNGFESAVQYMTQCIYYESGLHDAIEARQSGRPTLRTA